MAAVRPQRRGSRLRLLVVCAALLAGGALGTGDDASSCARRIRGEGEESTLVILKPDAVARGHVGEAISRFERAGLELVEIRTTPKASTEVLKEHYREHAQRKFYQELIDSMASGTIVIMHLRGSKAVARVRKMLGGTDPSTAEPGSLRGTFGIDKTNNFMLMMVTLDETRALHLAQKARHAPTSLLTTDFSGGGSTRAIRQSQQNAS